MRLFLFSAFLFFSTTIYSITISSNALTGNWSSPSSWSGGVVPGINDSVVIVNGAIINLNVNAIVYKMTINSGGTFNLNSDTLTLAGNSIIGGNLYIYGTFNGNSGTVYIAGNFYCTGTFNCGTSSFIFNASDGQSISGSTIPVFNNLRTTNVSTGPGKGCSLHPTNTIIQGNFIADGTWNRNTSATNHDATVTFNGNTQLSGNYSFYLNHIVVNPGATLRGGSKTVYLYGNFTCDGSFICENSTFWIKYDTFSSSQPDNQFIAVTDPSVNKFYNIYVDKTSGKISPAPLGTNTLGHIYVTNNFTVNSGTWDVNGTRQLWVGGNFSVNTTASFIASQGRLIMNGTSALNQMLNTGGDTLYKLTINNTGGGVKLAVNAVVTYDLTLTSGILYTRNGSLNNEIYLTNSDPVISLPSVYSSASYVKGSLRRAVSVNNYTFPVGVSNSSASYYRPLTLNISALNGTSNILISEDSITNASVYYADWWARILPVGGNPSGTIVFRYNLATDFISGMNECGIMASRGTVTPFTNWNYVLTPSVNAAGGTMTAVMPTDFSPYAYILGEPKPVASGTTICAGNNAVLNISSPSGYGSFNWYDSQTGGNTLVTGNTSYSTPVLSDTTTYWMAHINSQCAGHRWPVTVNVNPIPLSTFSISQPACYNSCATVTYTGDAVPAANYAWIFSGGTSTPGSGQGPHTVCNIPAGSHNVNLVVTQYGCVSNSTTDVINVPVQLQVNPSVTDATCGSSNGSVSLNVSGGWGNYSYYWSGGQTTSSLSGLPAGNYPVTITDNGGCNATASYSVSNLGAPVVTTNITQNVSCFGAGNGHVTFSATGTGTMNYLWSNGVSGSGNPIIFNIDSLHAATYNYTVTDANSCASTGSFTITQPDDISLIVATTTPLCYGQNNGTISVSATGGTGTYTFSWAHGSSQPNQINLFAGNYYVTVTDLNSCTETGTVSLTEPDSINIEILTSPISCFGESDGAINAIVSGGTLPYQYSWTGGFTTYSIDSLGNGTYNLSVLDGNNCAAGVSVSLAQPYPVDIVLNAANTPCYGVPGGSILNIVTGGTQPYQFIWDNGETTQDLNGLYAGIYWVTVTDDHGCTSVGSTGIQQPDSLIATLTTSSILCFGENNGSVQTFVSGGTTPYFYFWSNGATSPSVSGIGGGVYTVTITDDNGCSSVHSANVSEPSDISITAVSNNVDCAGYENGSIELTVTGGTPNYNYMWDGGSTSDIVSDLPAGNYSVTVSDYNGCTDSGIFGITSPDSLVTDYTYSPVICSGTANGFINLTTSGGTAPYIWYWSNGSYSPSVSNLTAGNYVCTIADDNGCIDHVNVQITASDPVVPTLIPDYVTSSVIADVTGGTEPYEFVWSDGSTDSTVSQVQSGLWSVTVTDLNGCTAEASETVNFQLEIPSAFTPNEDGKNDTWEIKGIGGYEKVTVQIFNRWGDVVFKYSGTGVGYADKTNQWDGLHNGKNMPVGVYMYIVNISGIEEAFNGPVTLLR